MVHRFEELCNQGDSYGEGKEMDNVVLLLSHMYNFKVIITEIILYLFFIGSYGQLLPFRYLADQDGTLLSVK